MICGSCFFLRGPSQLFELGKDIPASLTSIASMLCLKRAAMSHEVLLEDDLLNHSSHPTAHGQVFQTHNFATVTFSCRTGWSRVLQIAFRVPVSAPFPGGSYAESTRQ